MLRRVLLLVAGLVASPALADARMSLSENQSGQLMSRNVGDEDITVLSGQLNHRDDCELVSIREDGPYLYYGIGPKIDADRLMKQTDGIKRTIELPITLRPGEAVHVAYGMSPCFQNGSELFHVLVRTDKGDFTFDAQ